MELMKIIHALMVECLRILTQRIISYLKPGIWIPTKSTSYFKLADYFVPMLLKLMLFKLK